MATSESGRGRFGPGRPGTSPAAIQTMEDGIRHALELQEFELHYLAKVCAHTRRIEGVEALLRWRHPQAGLLPPASFLGRLETSGMIVEVGEWAMERAARDCDHWRRLGLPPMRVAVNISPVQIRRPDFAHRFLKGSRLWASSIYSLDVEITEDTLLYDSSATLKKLRLLRSAGVRIAVDDFGSGHSSLGRLSELPIDTLKIDPAFVGRLPRDRAARTVVSTIISLAHGLDLSVTAEGVETHEQLEMLRQMGCDHSQGYLHSRPVTRDEFTLLLQQGKGWLMLPADSGTSPAPWHETISGQVNAI